jgi:CRISPR-associated exonuclease Cas4
MFSEDELLPISALQHLLFCERQCALIHIERLWAENRLTVEGRQGHEKAHAGPPESRHGVRIVRGLPLRSLRLGLAGTADVVEFHPRGADADPESPPPPRNEAPPADSPAGSTAPHAAAPPESIAPYVCAPAPPGTPFPVEYKRGRPKANDCDRVQLCAQSLCLEEMLGIAVCSGALFYGRTRRREDVAFDDRLRQCTERAACRLHELILSGRAPPTVLKPKCRRCSLLHLCMPAVTTGSRSVAGYIQRALRAADQPLAEESWP